MNPGCVIPEPRGIAVELHCLPTTRDKTKARPLRSQSHRGKEMGTGTDIYQHGRPQTYKEELTATRKAQESKLEDGEGQGSLACCSPWGCRESDTTERLNRNKKSPGRRQSSSGT